MLSSARTLSKQVLGHRTQIQQQTKTQLRSQHNSNGARPKEQTRSQQQQQQQHDDDAAAAKMRQENRERKKRWRELNEERNKDNDLRCRVNKRANQLYGAHASAAKDKWIGEEFERRQQRRREKDQRRGRTPSAQPDAMPTGFGSYAALPPHQVRAADGLWRCVAARNALEAAAAVRLPPLSSVLPEELLLAPLPPPAHVPPALDVTAHMTAARRHLRPWETTTTTTTTTTAADGTTTATAADAALSLMSLAAAGPPPENARAC
ncbi:hypothetical protein H4R18_002786 [Coemansia javaensis]|uniref:DUF3020 domain-containing protein n=1 Tax=Coemansia javaensis TaxID=2761396 RepID=A0A9W8HB41_9FUNG|nr:hypothetical protein H4R18_002786 [Coemansia javaensis]